MSLAGKTSWELYGSAAAVIRIVAQSAAPPREKALEGLRLSQRAVEQRIIRCFGGIGAGLQRIERLQHAPQQAVRL